MEDRLIHSYVMADSSVLFTGRPFFIPDFAQQFVATPSIVVRTGRLGKCIAPKFAHRYWDAFTAGFSVCAVSSDNESLTVLDRCFDGAAIVGDWIPVAEVDDPLHEAVEVRVGDKLVSRHCLAEMCMPLAEMLAGVSTRCSIKMGDFLFTGETGEGITLQPGQRLSATIAGKPVLNVSVRL